jgi:DNA-nicking Smr family endonuclease
LNEEQYLLYALKEGYALLAAEAKKVVPTHPERAPTNSVTPPPIPAAKLQDALAATSKNPYVRARQTILTQMTTAQRNIIERMERGELEKDKRYDLFCDQISTLGDKMSGLN